MPFAKQHAIIPKKTDNLYSKLSEGYHHFFMVAKMQRLFSFLIALICVTMLTQCLSYDFSRKITQQGNLIPQEKIERLKIGMSKEDVAILMGTSLLSSLFNQDRWDYAYTWRKGSGPLAVRHVVLYFHHGRLSKIE